MYRMERTADVFVDDSSWEALIDPETDIPYRLVGNGNVTVRRHRGSKLTCTLVDGVIIGASIGYHRDGSKTLCLTGHLGSLEV